MTLLPGSYQMAAWWHGAAGSGKSSLAEAVEGMHNKVARLDLATLSDLFALEHIIGANLILVDEVECDRWKEGTFKTLVSGNGIGINRKHLSVLNYHSKAKWIITSNSAPFFRDKSGGVARRLSVVEWAHAIPESERIPDFHKTACRGRTAVPRLDAGRRPPGRGTRPFHGRPRAAGGCSLTQTSRDPQRRFHRQLGAFGPSVVWRSRRQRPLSSIKAMHTRYVSWCQRRALRPRKSSRNASSPAV